MVCNSLLFLLYSYNLSLGILSDKPGEIERGLARLFHELLSRDREDGSATGQPQDVGSETYLNGTSQGPTPEDARKNGHIRGRSK
ncbi:MAG: hypothetical protein V3W52_02690 [Syntrophobacteria bacterium]|jgi:hypothetical protein